MNTEYRAYSASGNLIAAFDDLQRARDFQHGRLLQGVTVNLKLIRIEEINIAYEPPA